MPEDKNVFQSMGEMSMTQVNLKEEVNFCDPDSFRKLVHARRSIRKFTDEKIPDHIVDECLDLALLAPNSSNLQTWCFYKIKNETVKKDLAVACFSQPAATSAAELIVCTAVPCSWRAHSKQMLDILKQQPGGVHKSVELYYGKIVPFAYSVGPLSLLAPVKWLINSIIGIFRVVSREPLTKMGLNTWAAKSCALACENLMLAFRSFGYDTCPMEGFDACRVRGLLDLPRSEKIVMIIAAGKRAEGGLYGPRLRFPREQMIKTII